MRIDDDGVANAHLTDFIADPASRLAGPGGTGRAAEDPPGVTRALRRAEDDDQDEVLLDPFEAMLLAGGHEDDRARSDGDLAVGSRETARPELTT